VVEGPALGGLGQTAFVFRGDGLAGAGRRYAAIFSSVLRVLAFEDCRQLSAAVIGTSSLYRWNVVRERPAASGPATGIIERGA
jgi:hypothetical protein